LIFVLPDTYLDIPDLPGRGWKKEKELEKISWGFVCNVL
jgi:hypothetical protein